MRTLDESARRIDFDATQPAAWAQTHPPAAWSSAAPMPAQPQPAAAAPAQHGAPPPPPPEAASALEAEWATRLEAPLSELAGLEAELTDAIDRVRACIPPLRRL